MPVKRHFLLILFCVAIVVVFYGAISQWQRHNRPLHIVSGEAGEIKTLPQQVTLEGYFYDKSGQKVTVENIKAKVILLNIWATWCPPCAAEMPALDRLQGMMPKDQFRVVAVSLDRIPTPYFVEAFLKEKGIKNLDLYWDKDKQIPRKWQYTGLPTTFVIKNGKVIAQYDGPYEWDKEPLLSAMKELLKN